MVAVLKAVAVKVVVAKVDQVRIAVVKVDQARVAVEKTVASVDQANVEAAGFLTKRNVTTVLLKVSRIHALMILPIPIPAVAVIQTVIAVIAQTAAADPAMTPRTDKLGNW